MKLLVQKIALAILTLTSSTPLLQAHGIKDWVSSKSWSIGAGVGAVAAVFCGYSLYKANDALNVFNAKKDDWKKVEKKAKQIDQEIAEQKYREDNKVLSRLEYYFQSIAQVVFWGLSVDTRDDIHQRILDELVHIGYNKSKVTNFSSALEHYHQNTKNDSAKKSLRECISEIKNFTNLLKTKQLTTFTDDEIKIMRENKIYETDDKSDDPYVHINSNVKDFMSNRYSEMQNLGSKYRAQEMQLKSDKTGFGVFTGLALTGTAFAVYKACKQNYTQSVQ